MTSIAVPATATMDAAPPASKTSCVNLERELRLAACRQALSRPALRVTVSPAIRCVAARSGRGPDGVGIVTSMCC
jgi:hypothetical protein